MALVGTAALALVGCGTWEIEPLPPGERGPQVRVPGGDTDPVPDAPGRVVVLVDRLDCPACAGVLETRLMRVAGVGAVSVDLKSGRAVVTPAAGAAVSTEALRRAAADGNFGVRGVQAL